MLRSARHLDESYSDETRSLSNVDMALAPYGYSSRCSSSAAALDLLGPRENRLLAMLLDLPVEVRKHVIESTVRSMPNRDKERIGALCEQLTKFDPAVALPSELMLHVFAHLSAKDLLTASTVSRGWRSRALDEKLWRQCFAREGWLVDRVKMAEFEEMARNKAEHEAKDLLLRSKGRPSALERRGSRKRKTEEAFSESEQGVVAGVDGTTEASIAANASGAYDDSSESMEGVERHATMHASADDRRCSTDSANSLDSAACLAADGFRRMSADDQLKIQPTLFQTGPDPVAAAADPKLSWSYLYKHRYRLEKNWEGDQQYRMFYLPHPSHRAEGHDECVYTIQHTARYLVSGSRDRTIRIWDLDTYRLKGDPLRGHEASVLCLQFDERPEHDLIVSGGSDTHVIIWQFSTGKIIKKLANAHEESVLNLRFDDRFIVTCSKDKSIKVWSRHDLRLDDPVLPTHCLTQLHAGTATFTLGEGDLIQAYSLITKLEAHQAAVNAVMIRDNTIVSASGDRTIRAWDLSTGHVTRSYMGHAKGIACVQFDGRRIVSGSSDNTVRIFDAASAAEIACLSGHDNLVRTVQARFGDLDITTSAELEAEAREADDNFYRALSAGMPLPLPSQNRGARNAGSSDPRDVMSVGTKVPPGGGGSRWAKIVSGSYDEVVIIWKRDSQGRWVEKAQLYQDALQQKRPHRRLVAHTALPVPAQSMALGLQVPPTAGVGQVGPGQGRVAQAAGALPRPPGVSQFPRPRIAGHLILQGHHQGAAALGAPPPGQPGYLPLGAAAVPGFNAQANVHAHHNAAPPAQLLLPQHQQHLHHQQPAQQPQPPAHPNPNPNAHAANHAHHAHPQRGETANSNRVFKLQFDARRIVCCSQNKVIVGWDFANADEDLERIGGWSVETG